MNKLEKFKQFALTNEQVSNIKGGGTAYCVGCQTIGSLKSNIRIRNASVDDIISALSEYGCSYCYEVIQ